MDKTFSRFNAIMAGVGSAFALFPTGALDQYLRRESVESRVHSNFAIVGKQLDAAMKKAEDEQKEPAQRAG